MASRKADEKSLSNSIIDFGKEYKEYKLFNERFIDLEYLNYKLKMVLIASILIISMFFIMLGGFLWTINIINDYLIIFVILFFFGYISLICLFLFKKERTRFKNLLSKLYKEKFV